MIEYRLTREIEVGAKAKPRYATDVIPTDGGYEVRNSRWEYPLFNFEFNLLPGDPNGGDDLEEFIELFHAAGGCFNTFKFRHWSDWDVTGQPIATASGGQTAFQLYRVYQRGAVTRYRKITRPVDGSVTVYANGVAIAGTVDLETGMFTANVAPGAGVAITADFQFDIPVRFADDELEMVALMTELDQPVSIVLNEVRE